MMKHFIFMFLIFGIVVMFFGCQADSITMSEPNQSDQTEVTGLSQGDPLYTSLAKAKASFTGRSDPVQQLNPGTVTLLPNGKTLVKGMVNEWYDTATDPRVAGQSIWYINKKIEADGTGIVWGRADLNVDDGGGRWEISWQGRLSSTRLSVKAVGTGKEGDVKGLVAKWKYTMIFANGTFYTSEGYIN
jgi:hypothetical protein